MSKPLTPADVRRLFDYSEGLLLWRERAGARVQAGAPAGHHHAGIGAQVITIAGKKYTRARLVWAWHYGQWPKGHAWHCNRDSLDDRIENLADLSPIEFRLAQREGKAWPAGTTRVPGGWQAQLHDKYLGTFDTAEEAHEVFKEAHAARHGQASPYAMGVMKMSLSESLSTSPAPSNFFQNGIFPANTQAKGAQHGPL